MLGAHNIFKRLRKKCSVDGGHRVRNTSLNSSKLLALYSRVYDEETNLASLNTRGYGVLRRNIVFYVKPSCIKHMHNAGLIFRGEGNKKRVELEVTRQTGKCERQGRKRRRCEDMPM